MIREVEVRIWDQVVGYAAFGSNRLVTFEYDDSFPRHYDLAPIMMSRAKQQIWNFDLNYACFHGLPGLLADSLPDKYGNHMIDTWFASQGIALGEVSVLDRLCYLGTRAMGALEFFPNQSEFYTNTGVDIAALVKLSQAILQERLDFKSHVDNLSSILQIGSSAGGARAKAVIALNTSTGEIRSGQVYQPGFEAWIIKLDSVVGESLSISQGYCNIEYAYYLMAIDCGIEMMESKLLQENGRNHFLTKRFDRTVQGDKFHMQTACALAHLDYNEARVHSYEILFRLASLLNLSMADKEQLFKRMVFNVIARNHDDHTKNFSFLMNKDAQWKLAPAYDLIFSYNPDNYWLKEHNLLINNKSTNINREDLLIYAKNFHIINADGIINHIVEICSQFSKYAKPALIPVKKAKTIQESLLLSL